MVDALMGFAESSSAQLISGFSHLGGDEVSTTCWEANAAVKTWLAERNMKVEDLQSYFEHELVGIARNEMQKDVIVWQEVRSDRSLHLVLPEFVHEAVRDQLSIAKCLEWSRCTTEPQIQWLRLAKQQ